MADSVIVLSSSDSESSESQSESFVDAASDIDAESGSLHGDRGEVTIDLTRSDESTGLSSDSESESSTDFETKKPR